MDDEDWAHERIDYTLEDEGEDAYDFEDEPLNLRDDLRFNRMTEILQLFAPGTVHRIAMESIVILIDVRPILGERILKLCGLSKDDPVSVKITFEGFHGPNLKPLKIDFLGEGQVGERVLLGTGMEKAANAFIEKWNDRFKSLSDLLLEAEATKEYEDNDRIESYLGAPKVRSLFQFCADAIEKDVDLDVGEIAKRVGTDLLEQWAKCSQNVLLRIYDFVKNRLVNFAHYCVNCGAEIRVPCFRPSVCENNLCTFQYNNFGMGRGVKQALVNDPKVVDLLLSIFAFSPYPKAETLNANGPLNPFNMASTQKQLDTVPSLSDVVPKLAAGSNCASILGNSFQLLLRLFVNNKCFIESLAEEEMVQGIGTEHQFLMFSGDPSNVHKFWSKKSQQGSVYGLYGVDIHPSLWHYILERGLGVGAPEGEKQTKTGDIKMYTLLRPRVSPPGTTPEVTSWKNTACPVTANCKILLLCEVLKTEGFEEKEEINYDRKALALAHMMLADWGNHVPIHHLVRGEEETFLARQSHQMDTITRTRGNNGSEQQMGDEDLFRQLVDDVVKDQGLKERDFKEDLADEDMFFDGDVQERDAEAETRYLFRDFHSQRFQFENIEKYFVAKEEQIFSRHLLFYPNGIPQDIDLSKIVIPPLKL